jgi:SAM-dependent methyltransferase
MSSLMNWFSTPLGQVLCAAESRVLNDWLRGIFGMRLLHLGPVYWNPEAGLNASPIPYKVVLQAQVTPNPTHATLVLGNAERLPFAAESLDLVILPHGLELSADPRSVLREIHRVLVPGGRLISLQFNPWSTWGLRGLLTKTMRRNGTAPWNLAFMGYLKLHDWLSLLGLDVEKTEVHMFNLPFNPRSFSLHSHRAEALGRRLWPMLGGVYMLQSIKRVRPLTPSLPMLERLRQMGSHGMLEPTTRVKGQTLWPE